MPVELDWLVEDHIVLVTAHGVFTGDDLRAGLDRWDPLAEANPNTITHFILDGSQVEKNDFKPADVRAFITAERSPLIGVSCIITPNMVSRFMASLVSQMRNVSELYFASADEALRYLADYQELPAFETLQFQYAELSERVQARIVKAD